MATNFQTEEEKKKKRPRIGNFITIAQQNEDAMAGAPVFDPLNPQVDPSFASRVPGIGNMSMAGVPALPPVDFNSQGRADGTQAYPFNEPEPNRRSGTGSSINNFFGTIMRASTPKDELGYTPPTYGDVLASANIRAAGGGILGDPTRTEPRFGPESLPSPAIQDFTGGSQSTIQGGTEAAQIGASATSSIPQGEAASPQANFAARIATGEALTPEEITEAQALARSMGTTFNPQTGYDRAPFEAAQSKEADANANSYMRALGTDPGGNMRNFRKNLSYGNAEGAPAIEELPYQPGSAAVTADQRTEYADAVSEYHFGTPMTGMRPIDPVTGAPMSQQVIDIADRIGLQLPQSSVPAVAVDPNYQAPELANRNVNELTSFKPAYEGQTLSDYMAGRDNPAQATVQANDFQGRLRRFDSPEAVAQNLSDGQAAYDAASQARSDGITFRREQPGGLDLSQPVSDRERRGTGEMSMADAVTMAGGDRNKARQMIELQRNGRDPMTGRPNEAEGGLTESERLARERFEYDKKQDTIKFEQADAKTQQKRRDEMNTEISALNTIIAQTENVSGVTEDAQRKVGANTTGFFSPIKWLGGTEAASLAGNLETIKSDAFISNITEMRQNSPTGGAVGNVSDKDLEMLQSLQTSFRQNLPPKDLRKNLSEYRRIRNKVANDAKEGFIRKYGQTNFDAFFGANATGQSGQGGYSMDSGLTTPSGRKVKIY